MPVSVGEGAPVVVRGVRLRETKFDYPFTLNSRVEYWVDYFTGRGRRHFERYLERSDFFIPYIAPILKEQKVPQDLVYLAMIESGFNNHARSRAKAVGPWQFMSYTGKRYGLMVNWWVDERRDIQKSTLAAVGYLKDLYRMFHSWELASAAYNAGENKMARAIQRYGTTDFWQIARGRFLRPETRDYVPKIVAAAIVAKNRTQFGFAPAARAPGADEAVAGDGEIVRVVKSDGPELEARAREPEDSVGALADSAKLLEAPPLQVDVVDPRRELVRTRDGGGDDADGRLPDPEADDDAIAALLAQAGSVGASVPAPGGSARGPRARAAPTPHVDRKGEVGGVHLEEFEVQSPADLLQIARAAGLSYQTVKALNPELLRWCSPPGASTYRLKLPSNVRDRFLSAYNHESFAKRVDFMTYRVRRGETLARVARRFGIRVEPIADLNGMSPKAALREGSRVILPMPNDRSRSLASLEILDPPERRRRVRARGKSSARLQFTVPAHKRKAARRWGG